MNDVYTHQIIACLDCPQHIQAILSASLWANNRLHTPIILLHTSNDNTDETLNYTSCIYALAEHEHSQPQSFLQQNPTISQGQLLLQHAQHYCQQHLSKKTAQLPVNTLYKQYDWLQSIEDVDNHAQLIVIGKNMTCQATISEIIRPRHCPILVVPTPFIIPSSALFAFDNSPTCHRLLNWLCQSPLVRLMHIHVVMVGKQNSENLDAVREAYARLSQAGIKCKKAVIEGHDITNTLLFYQQTHKLDMLISGAFGQSRLREWLYGSDTEKLLNGSQTPYLLFPKD